MEVNKTILTLSLSCTILVLVLLNCATTIVAKDHCSVATVKLSNSNIQFTMLLYIQKRNTTNSTVRVVPLWYWRSISDKGHWLAVITGLSREIWLQWWARRWGTAAAVPSPFRPSEPALSGSCPLVTPYYCRLGDLLCFIYVYRYSCLLLCMHVCFVLFPLFDLSFVDFPSVLRYCWLGLLTCKTVSHITYTVLEGT